MSVRALRRMRAAASKVAPVVTTSSTRMTAGGISTMPRARENAPSRLFLRASRVSFTWSAVGLMRVSSVRHGSMSSRASARAMSDAWLYPRARSR